MSKRSNQDTTVLEGKIAGSPSRRFARSPTRPLTPVKELLLDGKRNRTFYESYNVIC
ncbi:MAG TPA: hypothetical protein VIX17_05195 [Pyrinomonadaceae bacterium]